MPFVFCAIVRRSKIIELSIFHLPVIARRRKPKKQSKTPFHLDCLPLKTGYAMTIEHSVFQPFFFLPRNYPFRYKIGHFPSAVITRLHPCNPENPPDLTHEACYDDVKICLILNPKYYSDLALF